MEAPSMPLHPIIEQAQQAGVQLIRFLYCGNDGLIRGKATHITQLERCLLTGIGLPMAMQGVTMLDQFVPETGLGPVGEVRLMPDLATFAVLPYNPRQARLFCNLLQLDRHPWTLCPRAVLQRLLQQASQAGLQVQAAFETEFYVFQEVHGQYVPLDTARLYSASGMDQAAAVIMDIVEALAAQGIQVEQYYPEYGPGQHELSVRHSLGMQAADQHLAVRDTVRAIARQHGCVASLAPSPVDEQAGSGCHLHLSLWDNEGRNLFYDAHAADHLSACGQAFIAGILAHLPGLLALTAPSVNSYRRLRPNVWSTAYRCYGPDNREAAVRIPSSFWQRENASCNLEFRACDASCNPYLALAGVLAAGLDGLARQLRPGLPVMHNPALLSPAERHQYGVERLPQTLDVALNALQSDLTLCTALGSAFLDVYCAVKRAEVQCFQQHDRAFEIAQHRAVY